MERKHYVNDQTPDYSKTEPVAGREPSYRTFREQDEIIVKMMEECNKRFLDQLRTEQFWHIPNT